MFARLLPTLKFTAAAALLSSEIFPLPESPPSVNAFVPTDESNTTLPVVSVLFWSAAACFKTSEPALTVVFPVKVFAPAKFTTPAPVLLIAVAPVMPVPLALLNV